MNQGKEVRKIMKGKALIFLGGFLLVVGAIVMLFGELEMIILCIAGMVSIIWGCIIMIKNKKKNPLIGGDQISASVESVEADASEIGGNPLLFITCSWVDEKGKKRVFESDSFSWKEDNEIKIGDAITVYLDPEDEKDYRVDLESYWKKNRKNI